MDKISKEKHTESRMHLPAACLAACLPVTVSCYVSVTLFSFQQYHDMLIIIIIVMLAKTASSSSIRVFGQHCNVNVAVSSKHLHVRCAGIRIIPWGWGRASRWQTNFFMWRNPVSAPGLVGALFNLSVHDNEGALALSFSFFLPCPFYFCVFSGCDPFRSLCLSLFSSLLSFLHFLFHPG